MNALIQDLVGVVVRKYHRLFTCRIKGHGRWTPDRPVPEWWVGEMHHPFRCGRCGWVQLAALEQPLHPMCRCAAGTVLAPDFEAWTLEQPERAKDDAALYWGSSTGIKSQFSLLGELNMLPFEQREWPTTDQVEEALQSIRRATEGAGDD